MSTAVDLGPALAASERFGWEVVDLVVLTDGHINDSYLVRTGDDDGYVLQRINLAVFPDPDAISSNTQAVHRHLRRRAGSRSGARSGRRMVAPRRRRGLAGVPPSPRRQRRVPS